MPWPLSLPSRTIFKRKDFADLPAQRILPVGIRERRRLETAALLEHGDDHANPRQTVKAVATGPIALLTSEKKETQIAESAVAINKAVDEVRQIVESLEQALQQMEEVLRLVETAERQKITDEQEIESLRRALRRIQQPRSGQPERPQSSD